ncbi:DUF4391 domain-containing protein [Desulfogranum marinum]|uniref:DUF4391 domain-containing protein n=1 Tax=Desulfogranum marinum TaxID=453220 RepID=UPI0029C94F4D|nr:DUF4391 domain-containing protein [Desulfogranum marinum]
MNLYNFPKAAAFGKMLAKNKIYEHATPTSKVKEQFVREIKKITWAYKLSPATINLPASAGVQELQVLTITLRTGTLSHEVLQTIDKAIPSPILFMLDYNGKCRYVAAYKRQSVTDKSKWAISSYFETEWMSDTREKAELPIALNMAALYHFFLVEIISLPFRKAETLDELVLRVDQLRIKEREAVKLESRINKEKQFNRRVELNRTLNALKQDIENLKC